MPGDFKQFDPDQVVMSIASIPIQGTAEGDMITVEYEADAFLDVAGTDGEIVRSKNADRRATVTVRLIQSSSTNPALDALHALDMNAPNGAGVGTFLLQDLQGATLLRSEKAWIAAPPSVAMGPTAGPREWKIRCAKLVGTHGGN
jgi:hypothetical protein